MHPLEDHIKIVNDKLTLLLKKNTSLKKENETLVAELSILKNKEEEYKTSVFSLNQKINILKIASESMAETDKLEFEKRIDLYIKEIDKCIAMLSE